MKFGLDYAWGDPGVKAVKAAGATFVARYLSHDPSKNLRPGEAKVLLANGIDIVTVWETTPSRALAGWPGGVADAKEALAQLRALEAPADAPIYFAVDFDATEAQQKAINSYLAGAVTVLGKNRVGVYGGYYVVKRALDAKACRYAWQTYAWSGGQWDARAHIQQYSNGRSLNGVSVDYNRSVPVDFGQWGSATQPVVFHPPHKRRPLPGPRHKPKWFWLALKEFLARRRRGTV